MPLHSTTLLVCFPWYLLRPTGNSEVSEDEARSLAEKWGCPYAELSAKQSDSVDEVGTQQLSFRSLVCTCWCRCVRAWDFIYFTRACCFSDTSCVCIFVSLCVLV